MRKLFALSLFAALILTATSCFRAHRIEGNYNLITVDRNLPPFYGVESTDDLDVEIVHDSLYFVEIEAEENLIPYINTDVVNQSLRIETQPRRNLDPNYPIRIIVHTPTLNSIELSGSGSIVSDTVTTTQLQIKLSGSGSITAIVDADNINSTISGSGDIHLSGIAQHANFKISGSGDIHAYALLLDECIADISGSGNMYLSVADILDVVISGSGNIYYFGNPSVSISINGSGQLIHQ
ncbi:MAG: hypothetical protein CVU11_10925 [Bacteroidetes bacterium HGW-Bacteroidetes-6]|jgi:hypothetical protein|nr:MAG: hypothetical protein CVU11_10925 [Bacteroidetes bacterium HGW-Bacteroidetes-6]